MDSSLDVMIIGPAHPYRGGIAETNHELAFALQATGKTVKILTFTDLYPRFLFPGKTQFSKSSPPNSIHIEQQLHAYFPWKWGKTLKTIKKWNPKTVLFRYYTPFLSPVYRAIAKRLPKTIQRIAVVDNWTPHEQHFWDSFLNRSFGNQMDGFVTLSKTVAEEIKRMFNRPLLSSFHPIATSLPPPITKKEARNTLGWNQEDTVVLFFGLIRNYKGLDLLLKAFATSPLKETQIRLVIVGEFYEPIKNYQTLITQLKLESRVDLYPNFASPQLAQEVFCASDAIAQTYRSATQSGVTPLAYHYNTPLLVTDLPGLKAPIEKDQSGMISTLDPRNIAYKLVELLQEEQLNSAKKNIQNARRNYSWETFAVQLTSFIEKNTSP